MNKLWVLSYITFLMVIFLSNYYRVTCRDWFQLSLKEGLTVFRDQVGILLNADLLCCLLIRCIFFSLLTCVFYHGSWPQEFSSDMGSRTVKRIADVSRLRNYQFPQVILWPLVCVLFFLLLSVFCN